MSFHFDPNKERTRQRLNHLISAAVALVPFGTPKDEVSQYVPPATTMQQESLHTEVTFDAAKAWHKVNGKISTYSVEQRHVPGLSS